jgi:hypothetical protein
MLEVKGTAELISLEIHVLCPPYTVGFNWIELRVSGMFSYRLKFKFQ